MKYVFAIFSAYKVVNGLNSVPFVSSCEPAFPGMFYLVRVFEIRIVILFCAESFLFAYKRSPIPIIRLRGIVNVRFEKFVYRLVRATCWSMGTGSSDR